MKTEQDLSASDPPRKADVRRRTADPQHDSLSAESLEVVRDTAAVFEQIDRRVGRLLANFVEPLIWPRLLTGIRAYMERHHVARIADLVGTVDTAPATSTRSHLKSAI